VSLLRGGFPEVLARPTAVALWFSSYLQTYLERDVRSISVGQEPTRFRRFFALVASRHGQVLKKWLQRKETQRTRLRVRNTPGCCSFAPNIL
jgi:hypothetical protein